MLQSLPAQSFVTVSLEVAKQSQVLMGVVVMLCTVKLLVFMCLPFDEVNEVLKYKSYECKQYPKYL